ncbi:MAG: alanine--tRNA ligase [Saprospiraceae bacterium]|nr:alanine--tRNA ligase [Saprospiraceae bacterium]
MTSNEIRQAFLDFFESKGHKIVASAPIVVKNDPTLMFTNAGMNQFKDLFLGNKKADYTRIANSQKCLRVSGKHNDLEEVGRDSYHHTMFEMLGNWSIGDYFKEEAITWAWELLTKVYKLDPNRIYASVFGGDTAEGLEADNEAAEIWKRYLPEDRILYCSKKDNFWEMGDTGPCGPCSEIHYDMRSAEEMESIPGRDRVNNDDPRVVEIWNNVFIQYNRKADGSLEELPAKHIDTGMGFERLCRALQAKDSNYDTDVFSHSIQFISEKTGIAYTGKYDNTSMTDIAMRVLADHIRAVAFAIADGEMPGSGGAGYVIRRILRRSIRYNYTFLNRKEPFIYTLLPMIAEQFKGIFPELYAQRTFVEKVIHEEEKSFLRTLEGGLKRLEHISPLNGVIDGREVFELYDTYGFPKDLTRLIVEEKGLTIDEPAFDVALAEQKARSRKDAKRETGDWEIITEEQQPVFMGYDQLSLDGARAIKYRTLKQKDETIYQLVLDKTPFYAEGGGQVGDTGLLSIGGEMIRVTDTKKENDLIIHFVDRIPDNIGVEVNAIVDEHRRKLIQNNHSATHLLHAALRQVLGSHVQQKGSLVKDDYLRFDFAHFHKMTDTEIAMVEQIVNRKIRENIPLKENRKLPIEEAKKAGAMMLFGEKYGEEVRMVTFDEHYSIELCGGCHVPSTGVIGSFKIVSESAIAAGVRRIEAVTSEAAEEYVNHKINDLEAIRSMFKTANVVKSIADLQEENKALRKEIEKLQADKAGGLQQNLLNGARTIDDVRLITKHITDIDSKSCKNLAYNLLGQLPSGVVVFAIEEGDKVQLMVAISESLTETTTLHAGQMVKTLARLVEGGGGGQAFFATGGGKNKAGIQAALDGAVKFVQEIALK